MDNIIHAFNFRRFLRHVSLSRLIVVFSIDFRWFCVSRIALQGRWTASTNDENESVNRAAFRIHIFIYYLRFGIRGFLFFYLSLTLASSLTFYLIRYIPISPRILVFTIIRYSSLPFSWSLSPLADTKRQIHSPSLFSLYPRIDSSIARVFLREE